ncbi:hypothetical protein [Tropicimonas isoalkanivorans]|uniref:Uncharacterized protein n=1 Tax=Tropicimonas isoalkanivorans TaxID=441112 RepID=A0A1I1REI9_9RHOB|nr:hypothetical protein [Tropicimonas isoalkanivorans]SFD29983.1 hypothetical protein SAMN04488094_1291 [Tropicimonas isoalkanivorans]
MEFVSIDLCAVNLEPVVPDLQVWLAALEMRVAQTVARGGHMGSVAQIGLGIHLVNPAW